MTPIGTTRDGSPVVALSAAIAAVRQAATAHHGVLAENALALHTAAQRTRAEAVEGWCGCDACADCCQARFLEGQAVAFDACAAVLEALTKPLA